MYIYLMGKVIVPPLYGAKNNAFSVKTGHVDAQACHDHTIIRKNLGRGKVGIDSILARDK